MPTECAAVLGGRSSFADTGLGALRLHPRMPAARVFLYERLAASTTECVGVLAIATRAFFGCRGFLRFYTCRHRFSATCGVCKSERGRAHREQDHILLYLLLLTGSSSTSSTSRCPARATFETGPLLHGHVLRSVRSVVGRRGGGEPCTMVSARCLRGGCTLYVQSFVLL